MDSDSIRNAPTYKIIILGDTNVGKSSLFLRYTKDEFKSAIANTIGVDYDLKEVMVDGKPINLKIWDTAGQERFKSIVAQVLRDSHGFILVYDVNSRRTFSEVENLIKELGSVIHPKCTVIVGNKADLADEELLEEESKKLREFCVEQKFKHFICSAKTGENVNAIFEYLSKAVGYTVADEKKRKNIWKLKKSPRWKFCF